MRNNKLLSAREIIGVTDIGRDSDSCGGFGTLETGVTIADNQASGTLPERNERLSKSAITQANSYEQVRNNQDGKLWMPAL